MLRVYAWKRFTLDYKAFLAAVDKHPVDIETSGIDFTNNEMMMTVE